MAGAGPGRRLAWASVCGCTGDPIAPRAPEEILELALLSVVCVVAGLMRGFTGFGAGLVMAPTFALILGPGTAVPVLVLLDALAGLALVPSAARETDWRRTLGLAAAAAIGIPIGGLLLVSLDAELVQRTLSAVVLLFVAMLATGWRYPGTPGFAAVGGAGLASGLLTGFAGIGGPPVVLLHLLGPDGAATSRANLISYFFLSQLIALAAFGGQSLLTADVWRNGLILAPVFLLALGAGTRLFRRSHERAYRLAALALLVASGLAGLLL